MDTCHLCNEKIDLDSIYLPNIQGDEVIMVHGRCLKKAKLSDKITKDSPVDGAFNLKMLQGML